MTGDRIHWPQRGRKYRSHGCGSKSGGGFSGAPDQNGNSRGLLDDPAGRGQFPKQRSRAGCPSERNKDERKNRFK